jgi:hypothetical protein
MNSLEEKKEVMLDLWRLTVNASRKGLQNFANGNDY